MSSRIISSYDIIGSKEKAVAVVEISEEFSNKEKEIVNEILSRHKNVKSILKKTSKRTGIYRIREYKLLSGDSNTEVIHKESGCRFKLDPQKVYFSSREGTERQRIAEQVKPDETVMVMFAGVGPYPVTISKLQPRIQKVIAIELNPDAFEYMKENIRLNKLEEKIIPILGDVKNKAVEWYGKCDRVVMPLPHGAEDFLDIAFHCLRRDAGVVHWYIIESEELIEKRVEKRLKESSKVRDYRVRKVLPYAPGVNKYCVDIGVRILS